MTTKPGNNPFTARDVPRSMPFSEDAEKGVLCSLLLNPREVAEICVERIRPEAFYIPAHQIIYRLVLEFRDKAKPIDFVAVKQALKDRSLLEEIGGPEYLSGLYDFVPSAANVDYYVQIVREKYQLRQAIIECRRTEEACFDMQDEVEPALVRHARTISEIISAGESKSRKTFREQLHETFEWLDERAREKTISSIRFGVLRLDEALGGIQPGLHLISAGTGGGKSLLAAGAVLDAGLRFLPVAVFSLEMTFKELICRMFANIGNISMGSMVKDPVRFTGVELDGLKTSVAKLADLPIFIEDNFAVDIGSIVSRIRALHAAHGLKLVVIDYLQLIESSNIGRNTTREQQISEAARRLLILAKQLNVAIIAMSQVNDDGTLRDCRAIAHHADVWIKIESTGHDDKRYRELWIAKGRSVGKSGKIPVICDGRFMRFTATNSQEVRTPYRDS